MLLETVLGYKSSWRVLELMAETPGRSYRRQELKEYTQLGNKSLSSALQRLTLAGILRKKQGRYILNMSSKTVSSLVKEIKSAWAFLGHLDYDTKIVLNEFTRKTIDKLSGIRKIILFGSSARGTASEDSDIDIALVIEKQDSGVKEKMYEITEKLEERYGREVQVHYFTPAELEDKKDKMAEQVREEGKDLLGIPEFE